MVYTSSYFPSTHVDRSLAPCAASARHAFLANDFQRCYLSFSRPSLSTSISLLCTRLPKIHPLSLARILSSSSTTVPCLYRMSVNLTSSSRKNSQGCVIRSLSSKSLTKGMPLLPRYRDSATYMLNSVISPDSINFCTIWENSVQTILKKWTIRSRTYTLSDMYNVYICITLRFDLSFLHLHFRTTYAARTLPAIFLL